MNAAQRAQLLRERLKVRLVTKLQVGAGMARAEGKTADHPKRVRYVVFPKATGRGFVSLGASQNKPLPKWVQAPDAEPKPTPELKRRRGMPAVVRIADRYFAPTYRGETKRLDSTRAYR